MNSISTIINALISPKRAFETIKEKPYILVAFLIMIVISAAAAYFVVQKIDLSSARADIRAEMEKRRGAEVSDEELDKIVGIQEKVMKFTPIFSAVFSVIIFLILAVIFFLIFKLLDTEVSYKQSLSVTLHAMMPQVIHNILIIVIAFMKKSIDPIEAKNLLASNPGFLVDPKTQKSLHSLLSSIDAFSIWVVVLLSIGFSVVSGKSVKQTAPWFVGLWALYVALKVGIPALLGMAFGQ